MIKISRINVFNFENALRGMRHPLESYSKSDSRFIDGGFVLGENDAALAKKLILAGTDHSKFLRQIFVSMDIEAPIFWWKECSTYSVGVTANSTSTMHKLATTPITRERFSFDEELDELIYTQPVDWEFPQDRPHSNAIDNIIDYCEALRLKYLETKDVRYWRALIQILPESWNQTRAWTGNYQVLRNMYFARRNHRLSEWREFTQMIETLPYSSQLITVT